MEFGHGGDVRSFEEEFGYRPIDFSSNVSPLGAPEAVVRAATEALDRVYEYPDPACHGLVAAIARHEGVAPAQVVCGNGSADIIFRIAAAVRPRRALICAPTFSEYRRALEAVGCQVDVHLLDRGSGYRVDWRLVDAITGGTDLVFLCQPNNPTGLAASRALVEHVLERCREVGARLVADECFVDLLDDPGAVTAVPLLDRWPELVIVKAFTKLYGMPALRLGYALCADAMLLEGMGRVAQPWSVSGIAQAAGIAALECIDHVQETRALVRAERQFLRTVLASRGIEVQGEANYLFFELDDGGALAAKMRERGILIRDCSNYESLAPGAYRIAVKTHPENMSLLRALDACLR
ncbi:MAG: pyridoxal phosphate-dependent aminotransferase [Coriobacteriales bacterium]